MKSCHRNACHKRCCLQVFDRVCTCVNDLIYCNSLSQFVCLFVGLRTGGSVGLFVCLLVRSLFPFPFFFSIFCLARLFFPAKTSMARSSENPKIPYKAINYNKILTKPLRNQMERCPCQSLCQRLSGGFVSSAACDEVNTGPK